MNKNLWLKWRQEAMETFFKDIEIGYVDRDIVELIIDIFNNCKHVFTISSCSGRITIVDAPYPWARKESTVVFKKHEPVELAEIIPVLTQPCTYRLWLIASGPIMHFVADSIESAQRLLVVARESGFKHSGIISIRNDGIVVEIVSSTWISTLLRDPERIFIDETKIENVLNIFNEALIEGKRRLRQLHDSLMRSSL